MHLLGGSGLQIGGIDARIGEHAAKNPLRTPARSYPGGGGAHGIEQGPFGRRFCAHVAGFIFSQPGWVGDRDGAVDGASVVVIKCGEDSLQAFGQRRGFRAAFQQPWQRVLKVE